MTRADAHPRPLLLRPRDWVGWAAGPVLEKELRVASRRRRTYLLRFAYLAALALLVGWVAWEARAGVGYDVFHLAGPMARAGRQIVEALVWFQFVAAQVAALLVMSTAIREEVARRTLGVVLATPVSAFQFALGKLLGRMLPIALLVAVSLPPLVLVRVLGGVAWEEVATGLGLSLTTALWVGAATMLAATLFRHPWAAVVATLGVWLLVYYGGVLAELLLAFAVFDREPSLDVALTGFAWNPYVLMVLPEEVWARASPTTWAWAVAANTGLQLVLTTGALSLAARRIRAMAVARPSLPKKRSALHRPLRLPLVSRLARAVITSPIVLREIRPHFGAARWAGIVAGALVLGGVLAMDVTGLVVGMERRLVAGPFAAGCVVLVALVGLVTAVQAAPAIAAEREAGTLVLLLATPLGLARIVWHKVLGILVRCGPVWGVLAVHVLLFVVWAGVHPIVLVHVALVTGGMAALAIGFGLAWSALARRVSTAVLGNIATLGVLFIAVPLVLEDVDPWAMPEGGYFLAHPVWQAVVAAEGAASPRTALPGTDGSLQYGGNAGGPSWGSGGPFGAGAATAWFGLTAAAHAALGLAGAAFAARRLRRMGEGG